MSARVIAVTGRKGGVGKSTLALILASQYAHAGRSVLVLDLDVQGSASDLFGLDVVDSGAARVLMGASTVEEEAEEAAGLRFLTGGSQTPDIREDVDIRAAVGGAADVVLIDTPPGHAALDVAAMRAADSVLVCTEAHRSGISGAGRVLAELKEIPDPPRHAVVLGKTDQRRALDRGVTETLAGMLRPVRLFVVRQDASIAMDLNAGRLPRSGRAWDDVDAVRRWVR